MSADLRIGTLGAAKITPMALVRPARNVERVTVTAVAARDRARAETFAKKHGIAKVYDDYDALLGDPDLDAIYNPLPNSLHAEWTLRALDAGKHVLCEKPFTSNAEEAENRAPGVRAEWPRRDGSVSLPLPSADSARAGAGHFR